MLDPDRHRRLAWLIGIRAVVGTVLLGGAIIAQITAPGSFRIDPFFFLIALTYALTVVYATTMRFIDRHQGPGTARDVVSFRHGIAAWDFAQAAKAADRLLPVIRRERRWISGDELRDGGVMAKLQIGDVAGARQMYDSLASLSTRPVGDLRSRLLAAYVETAEGQRRVAGR